MSSLTILDKSFQSDLEQLDEFFVIEGTIIEENESFVAKNQNLIDTIKTNCLEIKRLRAVMQQQIKEEIEALCKDHDKLADTAEMNEIEKQEQQLRQEYEVIEQNQQQLSAQIEDLKVERKRLHDEKDQMIAEKERLDNETTVMIPIRREEVNLYTLISNIRWDFDGNPEELKGYISNKTEVKPFCYDKRKYSQFFITNALWDAMDEG